MDADLKQALAALEVKFGSQSTESSVAVATVLVEDYHKHKEFTNETWKERNRNFIFLVIACALYMLIALRDDGLTKLWIALWNKWVVASEAAAAQAQIQAVDPTSASLPFGLLQTAVMVVILYLMINIYHRTLRMFQNYRYLNALEITIRGRLGLTATSAGYSSENDYWNELPWFQDLTKVVYVVILGLLISGVILGLGRRWWDQPVEFVRMQTLCLAAIISYFLAYTYSVGKLDTKAKLTSSTPVAKPTGTATANTVPVPKAKTPPPPTQASKN